MQPQKNRIVYLSPARDDILSIAGYHLEKVGARSARQITEAIEKAVNRLADFPLMGQTHPDPVLAGNGFRKLVVSSPYVCVYKLVDSTVFIYRVVNGRMDYPRLLL